MPFDSGERTGVKQELKAQGRFGCCAESLPGDVRRAIIRHTFNEIAALLIPKMDRLDTCTHQVTHHLAGDAGAGGQPAHNLAIAGINGKRHTHDLAITTGELE